MILSRKLSQSIVIGDGVNQIRVVIYGIDRDRVKIGVDAPRETLVLRDELTRRKGKSALRKGLQD